MMRICDQWYTGPPGHHFLPLYTSILALHGPLRLYFEPLKAKDQFFYFNADPDTGFHCNADPDPASKNKGFRIRNPEFYQRFFIHSKMVNAVLNMPMPF
jgi:hypothetical protein